MKNSKQIADYVFKARDEYLEKKNKRKLIIGRITSFGTLGATVAAVLICAFNLLPILEDNEIDVLPPSVDIEYSSEYTDATTHTTVSPLPDTEDETSSESENNTQSTDPTEPVNTDVAIVTKPVLTTAVSGMQNSQQTQAVVTKPVMTSVVIVTQTGPGGEILEDFVTSVVTVTQPSVSTNANVTKPVITTGIAPSPRPPVSTDANVTKPVITTGIAPSLPPVNTTAIVTKPVITTTVTSSYVTLPSGIIITPTSKTETAPVTVVTTTSISHGDTIATKQTTTESIEETAARPTGSAVVTTYVSYSAVVTQTSVSFNNSMTNTHVITTKASQIIVTTVTKPSAVVSQSAVIVTSRPSVSQVTTSKESQIVVTEATTTRISEIVVTSAVTVSKEPEIPGATIDTSLNIDDIMNNFQTVTISDGSYSCSNSTVDESNISTFMYTDTVSYYDNSEGITKYITVRVYRIYGMDSTTVAIKFTGNDNYFLYNKLSG